MARWLPPLVFGGVLVAGWEVLTIVTEADPRLYRAPSAVLSALVDNIGPISRNALITAVEMLLGFSIGAAFGIALGAALGVSNLVRSAIYPWLVASQTVPIPAIASVLVIWFGFSLTPKVVVVALITFFPIAVGTADGLRAVDPDMVKLMRTMGASQWSIFRHVGVPMALPSLFSGAKIAATLSVLGAVFGEWVGARGGLGYLLLLENRAFNTDTVMAIIVVLAVLGIGFFTIIERLERLVIPWHVRTKLTRLS